MKKQGQPVIVDTCLEFVLVCLRNPLRLCRFTAAPAGSGWMLYEGSCPMLSPDASLLRLRSAHHGARRSAGEMSNY